MAAIADFKINSSVQEDLGFDATSAQVLSFQLENAPSVDVTSVVFRLLSSSHEADDPVLSPATGIPTTVGGVVTCTLPNTAGLAESWEYECLVNNGINASGQPDPAYRRRRMVSVRSPERALRKNVPSETTSYNVAGWTVTQNEMVDALDAVVGGDGDGAQIIIVDNIGTTDPTPGLTLLNTTPATGVADYERSPALVLKSETWDTGSSSSKEVSWLLQSRPTAFSSPSLLLSYQKEGGAVTYVANFSTDQSGLPGLFTNFASFDRVVFSPRVEGTGADLLIGTNDLGAQYGGADVTEDVILGDEDFSFEILSGSTVIDGWVSIGANPATTGILRLTPQGAVYWKSSNEGADVRGITVDEDDNVVIGNTGINVSIPEDLDVVGTLTAGTFSASVLLATTNWAVGTNYATTGAGRLENDAGIYWLSEDDVTNLLGIKINTLDELILGTSLNTNARVTFNENNNFELYAGASKLLQVNNVTGINFGSEVEGASVLGHIVKAGTGANPGEELAIYAQQGQAVAAGTNNIGGNLRLAAGLVGTGGTGGSTGDIVMSLGSTEKLRVKADDSIRVASPLISFAEALTNPTLTIDDRTGLSATKTLVIKGQDPSPSASEGNGVSGSIKLLIPDDVTSDGFGTVAITFGEAAPKSLTFSIFSSVIQLGAAGEFRITNSTVDPLVFRNTNAAGFVSLGADKIHLTNQSGTLGILIDPEGQLLEFQSTTTPEIRQVDDTDASATGDLFVIHAQNATGTTSTGGSILIAGGDGTTKPGNVFACASGGVGGGAGVFFIAEKHTAPTSAASGGIAIWADGNNLKIMDGNGVARTITAV